MKIASIFILVILVILVILAITGCGSPSDQGNYICKSSPYLEDNQGRNRCYQPDAIKYDSILFAERDTILNCEVLNNDSKDCRNACAAATRCFY